MTEQRQALLSQLGFRFGINGPHAARTMMLDDLRLLLEEMVTEIADGIVEKTPEDRDELRRHLTSTVLADWGPYIEPLIAHHRPSA